MEELPVISGMLSLFVFNIIFDAVIHYSEANTVVPYEIPQVALRP